MRRAPWLLSLVLPALLSAQRTTPTGFHADPTVSLRIWVPAGSVTLRVWDRDSIDVTGEVGRNSHFFGGGDKMAAKLGVESTNSKDANLATAQLVVTVPRRAHVWVKMTNGTFVGTGTSGELEVISVAGTVSVSGARGVVAVETIDASVTLRDIDGAVRVRGGSGRVTLMHMSGSLSAETISGALLLSGPTLGDARLGTINGSLLLQGALRPEALIEIETHDGPITLDVTTSALPALGLSTRKGHIVNSLPLNSIGHGRIEAHSFKGEINVRAVSGILPGKSNTSP